MIKLKQVVVVEGRYDKSKLSSILDATIIETGGFKIFKDKEKLAMLRILAEKVGLIILTDSDVAGFKIRRFLMGAIPKSQIINAYIPDILGKESRKDKPSAEGKLGVEGVPTASILQALEHAGVFAETTDDSRRLITKADFINLKLSGGENSSARRSELIGKLNLPEYLTTNSLIDILNNMMSYEEFLQLLD